MIWLSLDPRTAQPQFISELTTEITQTVRLAIQAMDGFGLSDEELDTLCDARKSQAA